MPASDRYYGSSVEGSSERLNLPLRSADRALTDPPYHDEVQYNELSMPLRLCEQSRPPLAVSGWARRLPRFTLDLMVARYCTNALVDAEDLEDRSL
jgi:hypothetical protein